MKKPFKFDFKTLTEKARRKVNSRVGSVSINLPFLSFSINPDDLEKRIAREIVIRMSDKRVLNACECCDNCVDRALLSLQEIRSVLVDKQVELSSVPDSPLYLLIELQLEAIRQFLTFEQRINGDVQNGGLDKTRRSSNVSAKYLAALEMLRAHLFRCLIQVSKIAEISIYSIFRHMQYDEAWNIEVYEKPNSLEED